MTEQPEYRPPQREFDAEVAFLLEVHSRLATHYDLAALALEGNGHGPPLDVCLGAILVQHTAWRSGRKSVGEPQRGGVRITSEMLAAMPDADLALLVRPSGTPMPKARRIKALVELVQSNGGFEGLVCRTRQKS